MQGSTYRWLGHRSLVLAVMYDARDDDSIKPCVCLLLISIHILRQLLFSINRLLLQSCMLTELQTCCRQHCDLPMLTPCMLKGLPAKAI